MTTKAHAATDPAGRLLSVVVTGGQAHDNPLLLTVLDQIAVPVRGRVRHRPAAVIADKAYAHPVTRQALRDRRIQVTIPEKSDQIARRAARGSRGGRPPAFDPARYRTRNVIERAFARLKQWRAIATRYNKHARNYRAGIVIAAIILLWL